MRVLGICVVALSILVATAAMAAENNDRDASTPASSTAPTTAATANAPAVPATAESRIEAELEQLRDLLEVQAKQLQEQGEELKAQREKTAALEQQLKAAANPGTSLGSLASAPSTFPREAAASAPSASSPAATPAAAPATPVSTIASSAAPVAPAAEPATAAASISAAAPTLGGPYGPPQTKLPGSADLDNVVDSTLPGVKLSGVIWLYDYQPFALPGTREDFNLYGAHLMLDRDTGKIGFHLEYRMRTDKLRPFFTGPTWAQQAYMDVHVPFGVLKAGEMYKQFGIFTDYSFYGGLTYFDGIKYDPEWGVSYEGSNKLTDSISLDHDVQFFRNSQINGSLEGRDVVSDPDAHRENEFVARVVPRFKLADSVYFAIGPSFERGQVTHTVGGAFLPTNDYWRTGVEGTLDVGTFKLFGEVIRQNYNGPFYPYLPKVTYGTVGINTNIYHLPWLSTHINYGQGDYYTPAGDVGPYGVPRGKEQIIQPALVFNLAKGFSIYEEYNYWLQKPVPGTAVIFDRSLNTELYIAF
jgi:hypothetical protein